MYLPYSNIQGEDGPRPEALRGPSAYGPGSYYEAVVIKEVASREYQVMYKNLVDELSKVPLLEHVKEEELRPAPPKVPAMRFGLGEVVDAFDRDGWWAGGVVSQHSPATYELGKMARLQQTQRKRVGSVPHLPDDVVAAIAAEVDLL
ncbi:hypothetical protein AgCh_002546 [Apium graveolens]